MRGRSRGELSQIEREVIAEIHALRAAADDALAQALLEEPARLVHHFLHLTHGNVKLRIVTIARECGIEMRTLERAFASSYRRTVTEYQRSVRLAFARWMLTISPPSKISAIAALLGYSRVQDFQRFFKKHMRQTPAEWGRMERERIAHAAQPPCE